MSGRREFVQRLGRTRNFLTGVLAVAAFRTAVGADRLPEPHAFARAYEPGEVVRFVVDTDAGISSLNGEFLGKPLSFVTASRDAGGSQWIGWGVISLEAHPGAASYRVTGARTEGASASVTGELQIAEKSFPEQRLTVESKFVNPPKSELARIEREKKKLGAIYARRTQLPPPLAPFVRPVPGDPTSEFGTRRIFNGEPRAPHPGIDLHAATGTPVLVAGPGRVALAQDLYYSGGTVVVDHGGGLFTIYAHLSKIEAKAGDTVNAGQQIALSGATGRVTGPHLHWGARVGETIFDPRALLDPRLFGK